MIFLMYTRFYGKTGRVCVCVFAAIAHKISSNKDRVRRAFFLLNALLMSWLYISFSVYKVLLAIHIFIWCNICVIILHCSSNTHHRATNHRHHCTSLWFNVLCNPFISVGAVDFLLKIQKRIDAWININRVPIDDTPLKFIDQRKLV